MTKNFFIPIKVENLAFYLSSACFAPADFYENRGRDVQTIGAGSYILMSTNHLFDDSNCAVEVCLDDVDNSKMLKISSDCFEFHGFLPLSRLVKIHFSSEEQMKHMSTEINLNTAFLPIGMCQVGELSQATMPRPEQNEIKRDETLYENYMRYQRLLGGSALMRIVDNYPYTYSRGYLPFIASMNNYIKGLLDDANIETFSKEFLGEKEWYEKIKEIERDKETRGLKYDEAVKKYALLSGLDVFENHSMHTIKTDNLSGGALIFAYLKDYKVDDNDTGARLTIDGLICERFVGVKSAEEVAFFFGYSRGYYRFTKKYGPVIYKYDLDNMLDMYVIETIFQHIAGQKVINTFSYIDSRRFIVPSKTKLNDDSILLLNQYVVCKKKAAVGSDEWFEIFFQKSIGKIDKILQTFAEYIAPKLLNEVSLWIRRELQDLIRLLTQSIIDEKEQEMKKLLKKAEQDYAFQLKAADQDLFEEIDTNHDGILSYQEIDAFLSRLVATHQQVKQLPSNVELTQEVSSKISRESSLPPETNQQKRKKGDSQQSKQSRKNDKGSQAQTAMTFNFEKHV